MKGSLHVRHVVNYVEEVKASKRLAMAYRCWESCVYMRVVYICCWCSSSLSSSAPSGKQGCGWNVVVRLGCAIVYCIYVFRFYIDFCRFSGKEVHVVGKCDVVFVSDLVGMNEWTHTHDGRYYSWGRCLSSSAIWGPIWDGWYLVD